MEYRSLSLPRQSLVSHLGFEPHGGLYRRGTPAGPLLFELIRTSDNGEGSALSPADPYMELAVYDLVGALFAPTEPSSGSRHADKLFAVRKSCLLYPESGHSAVQQQCPLSAISGHDPPANAIK